MWKASMDFRLVSISPCFHFIDKNGQDEHRVNFDFEIS